MIWDRKKIMEKKKEETKVLFVRTPRHLFDAVSKIAKDEYRTQVSVVNQAIKEFLEKRGG